MRKMLLLVAALIGSGALPAAATSIITLNEDSGICNTSTGCTFALSFRPTAGQLLLFDPGFGVGDVITFKATGRSTGTATFASDSGDGFDDPGDTIFPPTLLPPCASHPIPCALTINEPPSNTLVYMPTSGQPGFSTSPGFGGSYSVTSDTHPNDVAEPSSMLLLGAGLLAGVGVLGRKSLR